MFENFLRVSRTVVLVVGDATTRKEEQASECWLYTCLRDRRFQSDTGVDAVDVLSEGWVVRFFVEEALFFNDRIVIARRGVGKGMRYLSDWFVTRSMKFQHPGVSFPSPCRCFYTPSFNRCVESSVHSPISSTLCPFAVGPHIEELGVLSVQLVSRVAQARAAEEGLPVPHADGRHVQEATHRRAQGTCTHPTFRQSGLSCHASFAATSRQDTMWRRVVAVGLSKEPLGFPYHAHAFNVRDRRDGSEN